MKLTQERIDEIFETSQEQGDYILGLYATVFGNDWERVESIDGHPSANPKLCDYLCKRSMDWDREHKIPSMIGGAWLNFGFTPDNSIDANTVEPCEATYI